MGHVARMEVMIGAYKVLFGKPWTDLKTARHSGLDSSSSEQVSVAEISEHSNGKSGRIKCKDSLVS
jgi:hypothetical protein